jgi:tRNA (adenine57-N1/adenine58-N1)-methyltransferase
MTIDGGMAKIRDPKGAIDTRKIIGMIPGEKINIGSLSYIVLRPDTMDHLSNLERGPQMIIPKDSARIISGLGISNGSVVVEGGAGSGALTIALLSNVAPDGRVVTYDIRSDHLEKAGRNVARTPFSGEWRPKEGSIYDDIEEREVDAFVVDVPEPERTVGTASSCLRTGGRFCAYVPTFNQMERAVIALRKEGFENISSMEIIERGFSVKEGATRPVTEMLSHTGLLVFARWC